MEWQESVFSRIRTGEGMLPGFTFDLKNIITFIPNANFCYNIKSSVF